MRFAPVALLVALASACGKGGTTSGAPRRDDAGSAAAAAEIAEVAPLEVGVADVDAYAYRKRAGHPAFKRARAAEVAGTWPDVVTACREALAADPTHLDAAYLLAVALAKTGAAPAEIGAPLSKAVAGDFVKWGTSALAQPALQPFLATPIGIAWKARVEEARAQIKAAFRRALIVSAHGDLYAFDNAGGGARFHRLTRTGGAVLGAFRVKGVRKIAYLSREKAKPGAEPTRAVGIIDLAAARTKKLAHVAISDLMRLAFNNTDDVNAFIVYSKRWFAVDDSGDALALRPLDDKLHAGYPSMLADMAWLDLAGKRATVQRTQLDGIAADWDDKQLASTLKLSHSKRIVTVPSPGMIDGSTIAWSPDRSQLAFVVQLSDRCTPGEASSAVFVADAATGAARELERGDKGGMAVEWVADRQLAIAGVQSAAAPSSHVAIYDLTANMSVPIAHADGLVSPRREPACTPEPEIGDEQDPDDDGIP